MVEDIKENKQQPDDANQDSTEEATTNKKDLPLTNEALGEVQIELSLVLGETRMPIHQLLRMGRGAVIAFDGSPDESFTLIANNVPVARAELLVEEDAISIEISHLLRSSDRRPVLEG